MGAGRKTQTFYAPADPKGLPSGPPGNNSMFQGFRNLQKSDLGGVIFGCKNNTMKECLTKQLFGLPAMHYSYIRNIESGMPLFLFNYSDRTMHGVFEAIGPGKTNIDPYAWSDDGTMRTPYPAQVRISTKTSCLPLSEPQFKKVIGDNYYTMSHFWFELDHAQTRKLISLFRPNPSCGPSSVLPPVDLPPIPHRNVQPNVSYKQTLVSDLNPCNPALAPARDDGSPSKAGSSDRELRGDWEVQDTSANPVEWEETYNNDAEQRLDGVFDNKDLGSGSTQSGSASGSEFDEQILLNKLRALPLGRKELTRFTPKNYENELPWDVKQIGEEPFGTSHQQLEQSNGNHDLMEILKELVVRTTKMENRQIESDKEVKWLNNIVKQSEREIFQLQNRVKEVERGLGIVAHETIIYLVGGFNYVDWLSTFDAFVPSKDQLMPLKRMSGARAYSSVAAVGGVIFVFGGGDGTSWSDLVECYSRSTDEWIQCPPLSCSKGSLAGIALGGKIFAIGGGDGENCFSCMEMFDASAGKWVYRESMNEKRFAPAAIEFNGAIYTVGGYDGKYYLRSAERYDPREGYWVRLPGMAERRGCLSLTTINEKLYAVGGYDGSKMVSSVEIFDPRLSSWVPGMPMQTPRGYAASAMLDNTFYMMGGLSNEEQVVEIVECFGERNGWYAPGFKSIGKRCFFSAVVCEAV